MDKREQGIPTKDLVCPGRHVTSVCQGLSSFAPGGKMRDPGNEVGSESGLKIKIFGK